MGVEEKIEPEFSFSKNLFLTISVFVDGSLGFTILQYYFLYKITHMHNKNTRPINPSLVVVFTCLLFKKLWSNWTPT
jgi:hypothetical protein